MGVEVQSNTRIFSANNERKKFWTKSNKKRKKKRSGSSKQGFLRKGNPYIKGKAESSRITSKGKSYQPKWSRQDNFNNRRTEAET